MSNYPKSANSPRGVCLVFSLTCSWLSKLSNSLRLYTLRCRSVKLIHGKARIRSPIKGQDHHWRPASPGLSPASSPKPNHSSPLYADLHTPASTHHLPAAAHLRKGISKTCSKGARFRGFSAIFFLKVKRVGFRNSRRRVLSEKKGLMVEGWRILLGNSRYY